MTARGAFEMKVRISHILVLLLVLIAVVGLWVAADQVLTFYFLP